jgi:putative membrane protein
LRRARQGDVRELLANERTLLAWQRTALALIAVGIAVGEFIPELNLLGVVLIGFGGVVAGLSYRDWRRAAEAIGAGAPLPASGLPGILAAGTAAGALVAAVMVVMELTAG